MTGQFISLLIQIIQLIETNYFVKDSKPAFLICDKSEIHKLKTYM